MRFVAGLVHPREGKRDDFDPVRAGEHYRLSRELSLAIWKRVSDEASIARAEAMPRTRT